MCENVDDIPVTFNLFEFFHFIFLSFSMVSLSVVKETKKKLKRGDSQTSIRYDVYFETTSSVLSIPIKITLLRYSISVLLPCFFHNPIGPKVMTNKSPEEKKNVLLVSSLSHLCIFKIHLTVLKQ